MDQAGVEWLWVCRFWGFWQWQYLESKFCYKSAQMRAQMWDLAEGLHYLTVMGQVWCWAFALPGTSWWQRRGHTDTNTEDEVTLWEDHVHGTQQMDTVLSAPTPAIEKGKGCGLIVQARRLLSIFCKRINIFIWKNNGVALLSGNMVITAISASWQTSLSLWNYN